jgi:hypothetical protein
MQLSRKFRVSEEDMQNSLRGSRLRNPLAALRIFRSGSHPAQSNDRLIDLMRNMAMSRQERNNLRRLQELVEAQDRQLAQLLLQLDRAKRKTRGKTVRKKAAPTRPMRKSATET